MSGEGWVELAGVGPLEAERPAAAEVEGVELVVIRRGGAVHVLSGRCPHRAARLAAHAVVEGGALVCKRHGWDFLLDTGAPPSGEGDGLTAFTAQVDPASGAVRVRLEEVRAHARAHPPVFHAGEDVA